MRLIIKNQQAMLPSFNSDFINSMTSTNHLSSICKTYYIFKGRLCFFVPTIVNNVKSNPVILLQDVISSKITDFIRGNSGQN